MNNILVTGGAGFIGSNFIRLCLTKLSNYHIVNLDALTYAGNLENLEEISNNKNYTFVKGNICDKALVHTLFKKYDFTYIVNFAAESHVDRSIEKPEIFLETNILGTQVLLENAKRFWHKGVTADGTIEYKPNVKFIQVSTDEVYGTLGAEGYFTELTALQPNSPYSASKASADLFVRAYYETYNLPVNITRCSNNYGPYQFPEKLIPLIINNCLREEKLPIYGDGLQVRDWVHVKDHCDAIIAVLENGSIGEVYNIGGNNEKTNLDLVKSIIHTLDKSEELITYVSDRLGHDRRYAIDNSKIANELSWRPSYTFENGLDETIDWYLKNKKWMDSVTGGAYKEYYDAKYNNLVK